MRGNQFKAVSLLLALLLSISFASAQSYDQVFEPLFSLFDYIFFQLAGEIVFQKFLIWMLIYAILVFAVYKLETIFPEKVRKQGLIIAFVLSLMGTLRMPDAVVTLLFEEYAMIFSVILYIAVPALIAYMSKDANLLGRGIVFLLLGIVLSILPGYFSRGVMGAFANWLYLITSLLMLTGLIMMLMYFTGGAEALVDKIAEKVTGHKKEHDEHDHKEGGHDEKESPEEEVKEELAVENVEKILKAIGRDG